MAGKPATGTGILIRQGEISSKRRSAATSEADTGTNTAARMVAAGMVTKTCMITVAHTHMGMTLRLVVTGMAKATDTNTNTITTMDTDMDTNTTATRDTDMDTNTTTTMDTGRGMVMRVGMGTLTKGALTMDMVTVTATV